VRREDDLEDGADALFRHLMDPSLSTEEGNKERAGCVKVIPVVRNGPWLVKRILGAEKPAIINKKIPMDIYRGVNYCEVDIDTTTSSAGNAIISTIKGPLKTLVIDLAFLFESKKPEYLPERLLGTIRLSRIDLSKAHHLSTEDIEEQLLGGSDDR